MWESRDDPQTRTVMSLSLGVLFSPSMSLPLYLPPSLSVEEVKAPICLRGVAPRRD